jgi:hypothetical protein
VRVETVPVKEFLPTQTTGKRRGLVKVLADARTDDGFTKRSHRRY